MIHLYEEMKGLCGNVLMLVFSSPEPKEAVLTSTHNLCFRVKISK